jgi:hypothetical protein
MTVLFANPRPDPKLEQMLADAAAIRDPDHLLQVDLLAEKLARMPHARALQKIKRMIADTTDDYTLLLVVRMIKRRREIIAAINRADGFD